MHLTLLVPGLLLPVEILENTAYDLTAPTLSLILGSSERRALEADWLPSAFGLDAPLPAAALRKVGAGRTASVKWICLDPVRWHVAHEGVSLDDPTKLELSEAENTALIEAVQPLFVDWGELSASAPGQWEMRLKKEVALETQPLPTAIHLAIDPRLPGGADGAAWRRLLAEVQTVLHAHPVNHRREADGKPTVNSLWPWGQGSLPDDIQANFNAVWSNDPVVAGLCAYANMLCLPPPDRYQSTSGRILAILDSLAAPARTLEALAWREALLAFERDWLAPAVAALKRGECTGLRLIGTRLGGAPATVAYELKRSNLLRFWRKPRSLTELA
ncbi:MAG: hypothetical protein Q8L95_06255 [Burkholderiales bacterium]|nr:hypothetical protein [Burkholderiales bacterium]